MYIKNYNDNKSIWVTKWFGVARYGFLCCSWILNDSLAGQEIMVSFKQSKAQLTKCTTYNWLKCYPKVYLVDTIKK